MKAHYLAAVLTMLMFLSHVVVFFAQCPRGQRPPDLPLLLLLLDLAVWFAAFCFVDNLIVELQKEAEIVRLERDELKLAIVEHERLQKGRTAGQSADGA